MIPLLLTATVNPQGMKGANFSVEERARMYIEAILFYLAVDKSHNSSNKRYVVLAENSGCVNVIHDMLVKDLVALPDNLELVDVSGTEYDQSRGKGYNETILIQKAIENSKMIREAGCFFKLTGRLKLLNVDKLLAEVASLIKSRSGLEFLADCKDHQVYKWLHMPINGHVGECRYWFASNDFFMKRMWPKLEQMNDYTAPPVLAEDVMLQVCRETRGLPGCRDRFRTQARISGRGGHDLGKGVGFFYSTDNDSMALKVKCGLRQVLRWIMPFWKV